jgi:hypothetical protein
MTADEITQDEGATRSMWDNFRDVILDPAAAFEDIGRRPLVLIPLIVLLVASTVISYFLMPLYAELQELGMARQEMTPEQREQALRMMGSFKWVGLALAPISVTVITAIFALLFWAWGAISGARNATFKIAFSALVYSGVIYILQSIAQAIVVQVKGAEQVALEGGPPTFGVALFLERGDMSRWVWGFLASINFFAIWTTVVLAIAGIHALKMSKGSAYAFAVVMWFLGALMFAAFQVQPAG